MKEFSQSVSGNHLPLWKGTWYKKICRYILCKAGWQIRGELPDLPKLVVIVAPHTSNWDFILGLLTMFSIGFKAHWLGKHTIFHWPLGKILRKIGGIPVNRTVSHGVINTAVTAFQENEKFVLGMAPEGTRKRVEKWKMGFYYIARKANVPVVLAYLDYKEKVIGFGRTVYLTEKMSDDIKMILSFYRNITPKYKDLFSTDLTDFREMNHN